MKKDLSEYPPFGEVELHKLPNQGYSNTNYTFEYDGKTYLYREFGLSDRNREVEFRIQQHASDAKIAPKPYVLTERFMISEFVQGEHQTLLQEKELVLLAQTLQAIHDLPANIMPVVNLSKLIKSQSSEVSDAFDLISRYPQEQVLCHNDLNPRNLIWHENSLKVIDWEFAGVNDRYFDLAAVCVEFGLDGAEECALMQYYMGSSTYCREKLDAYKVLYRQLCDEWFVNML